jgi:RNA polymerase sigma-70 factor, ECF subfamily
MSFISIAFNTEDWYKLSATSSMSYASLSVEELVRACAESGNAEAWEEFVRRFRPLIGSVVRRIARRYGESSDTLVDDLIQETYLKVCANHCRLLRDFEPRYPDAFFGMLKVTAANTGYDYFRAWRSPKRWSGTPESELSEVDAFVPDSRSTGAVHIEREILLSEIDDILSGISSPTAGRDREIFWLHYRQGFTAKAIAAIPCYKLTTKGVESILYRLTCYVRSRLAEKDSDVDETEAEPEGISPPNTLTKGEGQS